MSNTLENIPTRLNNVFNKLHEDGGFTKDQAFQVVLDLIRRGQDIPPWLTED